MNSEEVTRLMLECCDPTAVDAYHNEHWAITHDELERFAARVAAAEREACAKVCEQRKIITPEWQLDQHYNQGVSHCAAAIRARSSP